MNSKKEEYRKNNLKIKKIFQLKGKNNKELLELYNKECENIKNIIIRSLLTIENKILLNLFSDTDSDIAITCLNGLYIKMCKITNKKSYQKELLTDLQSIIDDLTTIICGFGSQNVNDLIYISTGKSLTQLITNSKDLFNPIS